MQRCDTWRALAERQAGVVTHSQLIDRGLGRMDIHRLVNSSGLDPVARGVYLVGGAPRTTRVRLWTAVLATDGVIGFSTGAQLHRMTDDQDLRVHVIVPHARRVAIPRFTRVHRVPLPTNARRELDGLPVSSRSWSALDHLSGLRGSAAGAFFDRALQQQWLLPADVHDRLRDWRGRTGNTQLRLLATTLGDGAVAESERRLHRILRSGDILGWEPNYCVRVDGETIAEIDVAFPGRRLAIEIDGMAHHTDVARFRRDRTRQNRLVLMGWTVLRFTWADLTERPGYVLTAVRQALAA